MYAPCWTSRDYASWVTLPNHTDNFEFWLVLCSLGFEKEKRLLYLSRLSRVIVYGWTLPYFNLLAMNCCCCFCCCLVRGSLMQRRLSCPICIFKRKSYLCNESLTYFKLEWNKPELDHWLLIMSINIITFLRYKYKSYVGFSGIF